MRTDRQAEPDWRDADAYLPILDADRSLFAWEWLRRDRRYRDAAALAGSSDKDAAQFGLVAFEPPLLTVPHARPVWRADAHPYVLEATVSQAEVKEDMVSLGEFRGMARLICRSASEHLLLSNGFHSLRLDGPSGMFSRGSACPTFAITGIASAVRPLATLQRFIALARTGRFQGTLHRRETRARRWVLMLRTVDALRAGADQRDIAAALLSRSAAQSGWRVREPSVRSQVQRLVRAARTASDGGYRKLLQ